MKMQRDNSGKTRKPGAQIFALLPEETNQTSQVLRAPQVSRKIWKLRKGRVQVLRVGGNRGFRAKEAELTLSVEQNQLPFHARLIALFGDKGDVLYVGRKGDLYLQLEGKTVAVSFCPGTMPVIGWSTNILRPQEIGRPVDATLNQLAPRIEGIWLWDLVDDSTSLFPLPEEFYSSTPGSSGHLERIDMQLTKASIKGRQLEVRLKGLNKAVATVVLDLENAQTNGNCLEWKTNLLQARSLEGL